MCHFIADKSAEAQEKVSSEKRSSVQLKRTTKLTEKSKNA